MPIFKKYDGSLEVGSELDLGTTIHSGIASSDNVKPTTYLLLVSLQDKFNAENLIEWAVKH